MRSFLLYVVFALAAALRARGQQIPAAPQWYAEEVGGGPAELADADGDGVPDLWERRTGTHPGVADAHLDPDGDGLTNLEEFLFGSDPRTASTMGDGWTDREKRDNGLGACDRAGPAVTLEDWLAWAGLTGEQWADAARPGADGFTGACRQHYVNTQPYSAGGAGTVDFWLEYRTDRHAWLTVSDALATNGFPLAKGAGRARLRVACGGPAAVSLDPAPGALASVPGATDGAWLCETAIRPYRPSTVVFKEGEEPAPPGGDFDSTDAIMLTSWPTDSVHPLAAQPAPLRGGGMAPARGGASPARGGAAPPPVATAMIPLAVTDGVRELGDPKGYCFDCPPCAWPTVGSLGLSPMALLIGGLGPDDPILTREEAAVLFGSPGPLAPPLEVRKTLCLPAYPAVFGTVSFRIRQCGTLTGVRGVEEADRFWGGGIDGPGDHLPGRVFPTRCPGHGCGCLYGELLAVGFDHAKARTRNLWHPDEAPEDRRYRHCLGIVWAGTATNLLDFVETLGQDLTSLVKWEVNGKAQESHTLAIGNEPDDLKPRIFRIKMLDKATDEVWDRLILVVCSRETKALLDAWLLRNADISWTLALPAPFTSIPLDGKSPDKSVWKNADKSKSYLHHDAAWDMRSKPVAGGHGHQATYNAQGILITAGVAAGSADFVAPTITGALGGGHNEQDVKPFIRALQLDGNPCLPVYVKTGVFGDFISNVKRPMICQGDHLNAYLERRPATPTGTQPRP